ncbi:pentapeptide repeat-containing protein [Cryptosporangium arvum]|uniref:pentapeptide repeat-containing protein n=1 Tax=Cryptosporangium arvum TaxID=80871 RepID=UPI001B80069A
MTAGGPVGTRRAVAAVGLAVVGGVILRGVTLFLGVARARAGIAVAVPGIGPAGIDRAWAQRPRIGVPRVGIAPGIAVPNLAVLGTSLGRTHLRRPRLSGTHLRRTRLSGTRLSRAHLRVAHLRRAHLRRTRLGRPAVGKAGIAALGAARVRLTVRREQPTPNRPTVTVDGYLLDATHSCHTGITARTVVKFAAVGDARLPRNRRPLRRHWTAGQNERARAVQG